MNKRRRNLLKLLIVLFLLCVSVILEHTGCYEKLFSFFRLSNTNTSDYVVFLDVGQADCTLIHNDGKYVLLDAGGNSDDGFAVLCKLRSYGVKRLECIILSHSHSDHAGGLYTIINNFDVGSIICQENAFNDDTMLSENMLTAAHQNGTDIVTAVVGDSIEFGSAEFEFIWLDDNNESNDRSLVTMVNCNGRRFMFGGDITSAVERRMLKAGVNVDCDVLKASHHGSKGSNCKEFLNAATPSCCVVCCGEDNRYGFPNEEFLQRMDQLDIRVFTTAQCGDVMFYTDKDKIELSGKK